MCTCPYPTIHFVFSSVITQYTYIIYTHPHPHILLPVWIEQTFQTMRSTGQDLFPMIIGGQRGAVIHAIVNLQNAVVVVAAGDDRFIVVAAKAVGA